MCHTSTHRWKVLFVTVLLLLSACAAPPPTRTEEATHTETPVPTPRLAPTRTPRPLSDLAAAVASSPTPWRGCYNYQVTVPSARVRGCPNTTCPTVAGLLEGETVCVQGTLTDTGGWLQVRLSDGSESYMHNSVVEPVGETMQLPELVYIPPTGAVPAQGAANTPRLPTVHPTAAPTVLPVQPTIPPLSTANPTQPPAPVAVCDCGGNVYNCDDFPTHDSAQSCFAYCWSQVGADVHYLDRDGDGSACEWNP